MTDATYLLERTALNTMKDEDSAGPPVIRCALDEKTLPPTADRFAPPSRAVFSDPPFLSDGSKLVCSDPPIWVFDGLLSDSLLEQVDNSFDGIKWQSMNGRQVRMVELSVEEQLEELPQVLREISHIEDVAPCGKAWIMDVVGRDQGPHMDGWELAKNKDMQLLDLSKCSVQCHKGFNTIIPTLSFVIYFNNSGGITFPKASLPSPSIPAKRGRIVMFQNYDDLCRPAHNPKAVHYGVYGDAPKRVMTAGVMSSETPWGLSGAELPGTPKTPGFLYAPIMHRSNTSCGAPSPARTPSPPPKPKPKPVLQLLARSAVGDSFIVEARSLSGDVVAKVMLDRAATLGKLKANLGVDAQLVCQDQIIDGANSKLLKDTALLHGFEFGSTKAEDGADSGASAAAEEKPKASPKAKAAEEPKASAEAEAAEKPEGKADAEVLVEWDVIDTVFVEKAAAEDSDLQPGLAKVKSGDSMSKPFDPKALLKLDDVDKALHRKAMKAFRSNEVSDPRSADVNKDGRIDEKELRRVLAILGAGEVNKEVDWILAQADLNKDGSIDFEEFITWILTGESGRITMEEINALKDLQKKLEEESAKLPEC